MSKRKEYPHIKLTSQSIRGNYYGAYDSSDEDESKMGYQIFISTTKKVDSTCECLGYIYNKPCYHIKKAKDLEAVLFVK